MASDVKLKRAIVEKLAARAPESSMCPSDVAREIGGEDNWRELMPGVRAAAAALAGEGRVDITQGSEVVDLATAQGPIRIRRGPTWLPE